MTIVSISAFSDNYIWSLINSSKGLFSCVDPGEANPVLNFAKEHRLTLESIFITHHILDVMVHNECVRYAVHFDVHIQYSISNNMVQIFQ